MTVPQNADLGARYGKWGNDEGWTVQCPTCGHAETYSVEQAAHNAVQRYRCRAAIPVGCFASNPCGCDDPSHDGRSGT